MSRYLVFEFPTYYPAGGMGDLHGVAYSLWGVSLLIQAGGPKEHMQVLDMETLKCAWISHPSQDMETLEWDPVQ